MSKRLVTYSELRARRRCAYRAHLEYDRRLAPKVKSPGLREGTIMDEGLNALYGHLKEAGEYSFTVMLEAMRRAEQIESERIASLATLFEEEWAVIRERAELLEAVAARYVDYAEAHDQIDEVIDVQVEGQVPVLSPAGRASTLYDYRFKADGLVVMGGELWLVENKAWKSFDQNAFRALQMDEQCGMYLWGLTQLLRRGKAPRHVQKAAAEYGLPVGVYYNVLRKKLPAEPGVLKDGSLSKDKRIDTTEECYRRALEVRGLDPEPYQEILAALREKGETFFYRERIYRNAEELEEIGRRIYEGTRLLAEGHTYKFPTRDCSWDCQFFSLCLEWSDEVAQEHYVIRERRHEEYAEEEVAA